MKWFQKLINTLLYSNKASRYVSEEDQFLKDFDKKHPDLSASQQAEVCKHRNIFQRKKNTKTDFLS